MTYELGKQYEMKVVGIQLDSTGKKYIALHDDDPSKEYRVYEILKCQYEALPQTLYVKVKSIDVFGKIKFKQDEERLIREHYKAGKLYAFEVTEVKEDHNTNAPYYQLEDDFMEHRFYFKGEQKYQIGDDCILEVMGFTDKGRLMLKQVEHYGPAEVSSPIEKTDNNDDQPKSADINWAELPVLEGMNESETLELKSSIAFPPGSDGVADIDKQMFNILKELTAFMNTKGGELYIGVHDRTKKVMGIAQDFDHLQEGEDEYSESYHKNIDGYELKIRNTIDRLCPSLANSLTTIEFPELNGITYCKITVRPARRPIFLAGTQLFIRQGNRLKLLKGDEITFFIYDRMTLSIKDMIETEDHSLNNNGMDLEQMKQALRTLLNERKTIPTDLPKPPSQKEVDYWLIWFDDATWMRSRKKSDDPYVFMQLPVYKSVSDPLVVFCYESGKVNTIKLAEFRKKVSLNKLQKKGWSRTGEKPKSIFIMHTTDFLVGYSVDHNGTECVKLHAISDFTPTGSAENQGAPFLPQNWQAKTFATIGAEHKKAIAHLIVVKAKRTTDPGTPLTSASLKDEIDNLEKLLTQQ